MAIFERSASSVMRDVSVELRLTGVNRAKALALIRLAAVVAPFGVEISTD